MFQYPNSSSVEPRTFSGHTARSRSRTLLILTSLIDVMFVLLLYFMMASNFLNLNAISLGAPAVGVATSAPETGALLVEVRLDGVRFAGRYMPLDAVANAVQQRLREYPGLRVLVQPGAGVNLQRTVYVLDALSAVGATHLSLMQSPGNFALD